MSLTKPVKTTQSPVQRYFKWNGAKGNFQYWSKDKEEMIQVDNPLTIIPIDILSCVEGYSQKKEQGFRSNEVKSTNEESLHVRWNGGTTLVQGLYKDIKETVINNGGKYHTSIYGITKIDGEWATVNIKLKGAAMSAWIDVNKKISDTLEGKIVQISSSDKQKTGTVEYYVPVFKAKPSSQDLLETAMKADQEFQDFRSFKPETLPSLTEEESDDFFSDLDNEVAEKKKEVKKSKASNTQTIGDTDGFEDLFD